MSAKRKSTVKETDSGAKDEVLKTPPGLSTKTIERKVGRDEIIQLQKEGKLVGFDPKTGMGVVREEGHPTRWPGGDCKADPNLPA